MMNNDHQAKLKLSDELRPGMLLACGHHLNFIISVNKKGALGCTWVELTVLEYNNGCNSIITRSISDLHYSRVIR